MANIGFPRRIKLPKLILFEICVHKFFFMDNRPTVGGKQVHKIPIELELQKCSAEQYGNNNGHDQKYLGMSSNLKSQLVEHVSQYFVKHHC